MGLGHRAEFAQMTEAQILQHEPVQPLLDQPHVFEPQEIPSRPREFQRMEAGGKTVAKRKQLHPLASCMQLASHLEGDQAAAAVAGQKVGPSWLHLPHCLNAMGRHGLDA